MLQLRELRRKCGITMKELGAVIGVAESTISQYETGKRQPDYETLLKLSEYFGVSVDYLLGAEKKPAAQSSELDMKLEGIDFALYGEVKDLTEAQKRDVLRFVQFLKQEKKD